jgi:plastocyanin
VAGRRFKVRRVVVGMAAMGLIAFGAGQALGASEPITASPTCCTYGKASFTIDRGATATFDNEDPGSSPHDVTSLDTGGPKNLPLFRSSQITLGQTPVSGTNALGPGTYKFFCTVHPTEMQAQLVVTPSASPTIAVTILSRKVGQVASSGKVKVKLRGLLASNNISVVAKVGKKKLGSTRVTSVGAGAASTVKVPLSRAGKNFLSHRGSAKLKVTASPPGDQAVTASRRLG